MCHRGGGALFHGEGSYKVKAEMENTGETVPSSGSLFSACLVVEDSVVVAPGKGEGLGTRESWRGLKE